MIVVLFPIIGVANPASTRVPLANPVVFLWNQSRSNDHVTWASACSLCVSVLISGLMYWDPV